MALIKCEDCGKEISDKTPACIHCGCPIEIAEKDNDHVNDEELEEEYEEDCASWYDLSNDRQNELKEEFYEKISKKPQNVSMVTFLSSMIGAGFGLFLSIPLIADGYDENSTAILGIVYFWCFVVGLICGISVEKNNKKIDKDFISWLEHSKNIYKNEE